MKLHDPRFLSFAGEPITGRAPPQMLVYGGVLTQGQYGAVTHAYKLFRDALSLSVSQGYLVQNRILEDGTRVRMVSIQDHDQVFVWVGGEAEEGAIPHGFVVASNWGRPVIYKFRPTPGTWAVDSILVPQVARPEAKVTGYNQAVRLVPDAHDIVLPLVYSHERELLWDYAKHAAPLVSGTHRVPANAHITAAAYDVHKAHILVDNTVQALDGTTLYTMTLPGQITIEGPQLLPGNTDSTGEAAVLQAWRKAVISPTVDRFRFANEVLTRTAETTYSAVRKDVEFDTPIDRQTVVGSQESDYTIDESVSVQIYLLQFLWTGTLAGTDQIPYINGAYGWVRNFYDWTDIAATTEDAWHSRTTRVAGTAYTLENIVALPEAAGVSHATLTSELNYPSVEYWRGGWKTKSALMSGWEQAVGQKEKTIRRADAQWSMSGTPSATLAFGPGWAADVKLLEGTVAGDLLGKHYEDTTLRYHGITSLPADLDYMASETPAVGEIPPLTVKEWFESKTNHASATYSEFNAEWDMPLEETTVTDQPTYNTGSYSFTSRQIIDFDSRGQFYAAIRVDVICSGARWDQVVGGYRGGLSVTADPGYTVNIYFESRWKDQIGLQLLATAGATRPAFEFATINATNVFLYPSTSSELPLNYHQPPQLQLPRDVVDSFVALASHQGVNPHLACQDVLDVPDDHRVNSPNGIEFSYLRAGREIPHERRVIGQLYARTFKLADVSSALWLLSALACDAKENNGALGPDWYYMPELGATIANTDFHVEVRNGVIGDWSGDIPETDGGVRPAPTGRQIELYQV